MASILSAFAMVFLAEMGDKTQLFLIGLSTKYKLRSIVFGVVAAVAVLNGAAVALGFLVGKQIDPSTVKIVAGAAFLGFAYTALFPKKDEEEGVKGGRGAFFAVFFSFLLAELGDKTQLMTLTLAAESSAEGGGIVNAFGLFAACSLGLLAADALGIVIGHVLAKKLPERALGWISFAIFTFFGIFTVYEAVNALSDGAVAPVVITVISVTLAFAALCGVTLAVLERKKMRDAKKETSCEKR